MKYILTAGWDDGIAELTAHIARELAAGKKVLWLTSGGSNIQASVQVMANIAPQLSRYLSIMPADERFGPAGHPDSNWAQLIKAGFEANQATLLPVLKDGQSFEQAIEDYQKLAARAFKENDTLIAQLGIGEDGHIAGILPGSPAVKEEKALATGYNTPTYRRLTLTFPAIRQLNAVYAFAFGEAKHGTLLDLQQQQPLDIQPAQILKQLPFALLYNDQVGETNG